MHVRFTVSETHKDICQNICSSVLWFPSLHKSYHLRKLSDRYTEEPMKHECQLHTPGRVVIGWNVIGRNVIGIICLTTILSYRTKECSSSLYTYVHIRMEGIHEHQQHFETQKFGCFIHCWRRPCVLKCPNFWHVANAQICIYVLHIFIKITTNTISCVYYYIMWHKTNVVQLN